MSVKLNQVVPWGRSLEEYRRMFNLAERELNFRILGVGDGPASFNCDMTALGHRVISIDPIYLFSKEQIAQRIEDTYDSLISQVKRNPENYVWDVFQDADDCGRSRLDSMRKFLADFDAGLAAGRYLPESLPSLSFADDQFDLALCSHLLFLYSEQLSSDFHRASIQEICRVAKELRIFPLLALDCRESPYVEPIQSHFSRAGFAVEICPVPYEFQRGGNRMMRIYRN